ncbi:unnamed protein product [Rotaria sp. Silwood1]|nr:unnamed protein product [Rotaria sp. Silwood1]CAF1157849.1 unnamed protein product [Rotaria sp. Silwood1]CAF3426478.1 unnamed protein product [Rotaria sp. Silwood1]CAF3461418.1 unnamed protein product [Rotaria sp. Silwood1]CAF4574925.1 unnamed protein product [Rotaria sp. Silwood1]
METMTHSAFDSQIETLISTFIDEVLADYHRTLSFIIGSFEVNQLLNMFTGNWQLDFTNEKENYIMATRPRVFSSSNCTCATTSNCIEQIREDVISGCFPFDEFRFTKYEDTSLDELNKKLFVESWHNHSNYSAYFETCQPTECRHVQFDRHDLLYTLMGNIKYSSQFTLEEIALP